MPTQKQKKAVEKIVENHGNVSRAMMEAGYDPTTAKNPSNLTNSKGFQELMEQYLPDTKLFLKHDELLQATKQLSARNGKDANAETDDFIEVPDYQVQVKALELGYKVKGKLSQPSVNVLNQGEMNMGLLINESKN